jgi:hypothetical protein
MDKTKKYKEEKIAESNLPEEIIANQENEDPNITSNNPYGAVDFLIKKQQERQEKSYYDEQKRLEKQKRINAFTDALRLLSDTVGYSKGASISKREPSANLDRSIESVRQNILSNKEAGDKATLSIVLQRAKEKEAQQKYDKERKRLLDEYNQKLSIANEYEKGILQQKLDNSLAEIEARHAADMKEIELAQGYQNKRAANTQAQINERFNKSLNTRNQPKPGQKESGLYELTDEQGGTAAKVNQGGIDRMASEIIKDPVLAKEYDVIVNRYGDGLEKENAKRVFVQKYWNKSPGLKQLGLSLNRSKSIQPETVHTVNLVELESKLGSALDVIDNEYTKIEQSTIDSKTNIPDYGERYRRLYNLLIASKKLNPDEAKAYAQEIVYNN